MAILQVLLWCLVGTGPALGARVLVLQPFAGPSQAIMVNSLARELALRGHQLTVVSPFPLREPPLNYTSIDISSATQPVVEGLGEGLYSEMWPWEEPMMLWRLGEATTRIVLQEPQVLRLLQDQRGFDLVIVEAFMNEAAYGFAHYFKAPLVEVCTFVGWPWLNYGHGNPAPASYVPDPLSSYSDRMSFPQRLNNLLIRLLWHLGNSWYYLPSQESIRQQVFGCDSPSVWDLRRSVSLTLLNSHYSTAYPRPLVPSIVEVGGLHVKSRTDPLPPDIQSFLDGATEGAIYFSMGSNLRGEMMPEQRQQAFLRAFASLPPGVRVLWKWEGLSMEHRPDNVMVAAWMPQQDILAHPNVRVFITHGGLLSTQEAAYHGVPLVGIPMFGDQALNMRRAEQAGIAVLLRLNNATEESVSWAIRTVLYEPRYSEAARRRAVLFRDQLESPLDRAVFWTEFVLRHRDGGSMTKLRSAAADLSWFQLYLLDVFAALLLAGSCIVMAARCVVRACWRACTKSFSKDTPAAHKKIN